MKAFNLSQTRAEVAEQIVDAAKVFLNKSGYTKNFWLVWNSAELSIQYHLRIQTTIWLGPFMNGV